MQIRILILKVLQILQGQFRGFHFLISFLDPTRESFFFISVGICSQIFGPKYEADSLPFKTLWITPTRNCIVYLRLETPFIIPGEMPLAPFYMLIASA